MREGVSECVCVCKIDRDPFSVCVSDRPGVKGRTTVGDRERMSERVSVYVYER